MYSMYHQQKKTFPAWVREEQVTAKTSCWDTHDKKEKRNVDIVHSRDSLNKKKIYMKGWT